MVKPKTQELMSMVRPKTKQCTSMDPWKFVRCSDNCVPGRLLGVMNGLWADFVEKPTANGPESCPILPGPQQHGQLVRKP